MPRVATRPLALLRGHLPLLVTVGAVLASCRGRPRTAALLGAAGATGFTLMYRRHRAAGLARTQRHIDQLRRLRPEVLKRFYIECVGSMEAELEYYPAYDQRKHELRYRRVVEEAAQHARAGDVVVDVGCASGVVLDRLSAQRGTRGIGFDLAPFGLHERRARPGSQPVLAQAVVEHVPLPDGIADVVVFSEVIEHLIDAYAGLREVSRITRDGGVMVLTTNNASEMPEMSPLRDPLLWIERLWARSHPESLSFRNVMWPRPINAEVDPLPRDAPTYAPHIHFAACELIRLAHDAGFDLVSEGSFEFPAPQSGAAAWLRSLTARNPRAGNLASDVLEGVVGRIPGLRLMGTHHLLVFRKARPARIAPALQWWPAIIVLGDAPDAPVAPTFPETLAESA